MTSEAETAAANAIAFEVKKDGLQQRQSGDWILRLTLAALDMDQRITQAAMGTRYQCVLVEITDDDSPRDRKREEKGAWRDLGAAQQAGIRCKDPVFWAWLEEQMHYTAMNEEQAAAAVRHMLGILSRSELNKPGSHSARTTWHRFDNQFEAWRVSEHG